jgi:predicted O-methyltransferase YrrM
MNQPLRTTLLATLPAFHHRNGVPQTGGLDASLLEFIERVIADAGALEGFACETGAGLSSVWLLCLGLREVHSFCNRVEVCERIGEYLGSFPDEHARWRCHIGPSQLTLPPHAIQTAAATADFCLIDGGHGLDTVFNDFVYLNYLLKPGGLLAIDDMQLGSCRLLAEWLIQPRMGYSIVDRVRKLVVLRKETDRRLIGDFGWQTPFLERLAGCLGDLP